MKGMLRRKVGKEEKFSASFASRLSENENPSVNFHLRSVQNIALFFQVILPRFDTPIEHRKTFDNWLMVLSLFHGKNTNLGS